MSARQSTRFLPPQLLPRESTRRLTLFDSPKGKPMFPLALDKGDIPLQVFDAEAEIKRRLSDAIEDSQTAGNACEQQELKMRKRRCGAVLVALHRAWQSVDGTVLFLAVLSAIAAVALHFGAHNWELASNQGWRWFAAFVGCVIVYYLSALLETAILSLLSLSIGTRAWKLFYYASAISGSLRSILLVAFLFYLRADDKNLQHFIHLPGLLDQILIPLQAVLIAHLFRKVLMKEIVFRINREAYTKRVSGLLHYEHVLHTLLEPLPDQVVAAASAIRANTKTGAGAEADSQGTVFFRLMHRMQLNQDQHSRVLSDHDARETAQAIMANLDQCDRGFLTEDDFGLVIDKGEAKAAFALFAATDGKVTKKHLTKGVKKYLQERHNVTQELQDYTSMSGVLLSLANAVFWVLVVLVLLTVYGDIFRSFLLPIGTLLLSLSFMFSAAVQRALESCIFILVTRPYTIGDRVNVPDLPGENRFTVTKIELLTTHFRTLHGQAVQVANHLLASKVVCNLTRSAQVSFELKYLVYLATSMESIKLWRQSVQTFVDAHPRDFKPKMTLLVANADDRPGYMTLSLWVDSTHNHSENELVGSSKTALSDHARLALFVCGIRCEPPCLVTAAATEHSATVAAAAAVAVWSKQSALEATRGSAYTAAALTAAQAGPGAGEGKEKDKAV